MFSLVAISWSEVLKLLNVFRKQGEIKPETNILKYCLIGFTFSFYCSPTLTERNILTPFYRLTANARLAFNHLAFISDNSKLLFFQQTAVIGERDYYGNKKMNRKEKRKCWRVLHM